MLRDMETMSTGSAYTHVHQKTWARIFTVALLGTSRTGTQHMSLNRMKEQLGPEHVIEFYTALEMNGLPASVGMGHIHTQG